MSLIFSKLSKKNFMKITMLKKFKQMTKFQNQIKLFKIMKIK